MMRRSAATLAIVMVLASAANAGPKRRQTASLLAGVGTGASGALIIASFLTAPRYGEVNEAVFYTGAGSSLITPSLGHFYAGEYLTWGMAVRAASVALGVYAIAGQTETVACTSASTVGSQCQQITSNGIAILIVAGVGYIGGAAYDVLDAPDAVDRWNRKHGIALTPTAMRDVAGAPVAGLALRGTF